MKKELIDGYEIYSENGEFKKIVFKDYLGNEVCISIEQNLEQELLKRRREGYSEEHEKRSHLDTYLSNEHIFDTKTSKHIHSAEDTVIHNDETKRIIKEIWKLPLPQNRRVYMHIVDELSLTEISQIEERDVAAIKRSVDAGIKKLRKKLKNF